MLIAALGHPLEKGHGSERTPTINHQPPTTNHHHYLCSVLTTPSSTSFIPSNIITVELLCTVSVSDIIVRVSGRQKPRAATTQACPAHFVTILNRINQEQWQWTVHGIIPFSLLTSPKYNHNSILCRHLAFVQVRFSSPPPPSITLQTTRSRPSLLVFALALAHAHVHRRRRTTY